MILAEVEINLEEAFDILSTTEQLVFAKYAFDNLSDDERKIFLSYIAANYPDLIQIIKEH